MRSTVDGALSHVSLDLLHASEVHVSSRGAAGGALFARYFVLVSGEGSSSCLKQGNEHHRCLVEALLELPVTLAIPASLPGEDATLIQDARRCTNISRV
jgi:hypothetical protein